MNDNIARESVRSRELVADETERFDLFLRDEGLELVSAYRAIKCPRLRRSLRDLIAMIAAEDEAKRQIR